MYRRSRSRVHATAFTPGVADRGHGASRTQQSGPSVLLVDHHRFERLRHRRAVGRRLLQSAHVLRDQADHVAAERQERQDGQRHLKSRLHRAARGRRVPEVCAPQRHGAGHSRSRLCVFLVSPLECGCLSDHRMMFCIVCGGKKKNIFFYH